MPHDVNCSNFRVLNLKPTKVARSKWLYNSSKVRNTADFVVDLKPFFLTASLVAAVAFHLSFSATAGRSPLRRPKPYANDCEEVNDQEKELAALICFNHASASKTAAQWAAMFPAESLSELRLPQSQALLAEYVRFSACYRTCHQTYQDRTDPRQ